MAVDDEIAILGNGNQGTSANYSSYIVRVSEMIDLGRG
jgi:hypothetical protein